MIYFESNADYYILIPTIAISRGPEFWIEIDWLNYNFGWVSRKRDK